MAADPKNDLLRQTDAAREVGFLIIYCANIEIWMLPALASLLSGNGPTARAILGPIDNLRAKIDIVFGLAELQPALPFAAALIARKGATLKALAFRNSIAHGYFGIGEDDALCLISNVLSDRRGKPKHEAMIPENIRAHVQALKDFIGVVSEQVNHQYRIGFPVPAPASPDTLTPASPKAMKPRKARKAQRTRTPPQS